MRLLKFALPVALLVSASFPVSAGSADLKVTGNIRPSACDVSLSGNGVVDFGKINVASLTEGKINVLPRMRVDVIVKCESPTRFALSFTDNRQATVVEETKPRSLIPTYSFGLGKSSIGRNIGSMNITQMVSSTVADGNSVVSVFQNRGRRETYWNAADLDYAVSPLHTYGVASRADLVAARERTGRSIPVVVPGAFTTLIHPLEVEVRLPSRSKLPDLSNDFKLDGMVTITLHTL